LNTSYLNTLATKIEELKKNGNYRYFLDSNKSSRHFPRFYFFDDKGNKRSAVNWCSNDYLCMSIDEDVISKLTFTAHHCGVGSGGTRNISGTSSLHKELETTIANLHNKESALVFNSAFLANLSALSTLGKAFESCIFISDERNHSSLIEGIKSSGAEKIIFRHNDTDHLERILRDIPLNRAKIIVFESVYSINGSIAPVEKITLLAKKYNAISYIDEVHAVGIYGKKGSGMCEELKMEQNVDVINGTLAKAFGTLGGYIAGNSILIDFVRSFGAGFIFTTSLPPSLCSATIKSISKVSENEQMRQEYMQKVKQLRKLLKDARVPYLSNQSHITPIHIGNSKKCKEIASALLNDFGIYLQPINPPTVKHGEDCLRLTVSLRHTEDDMVYLADSLSKLLR
jgi:5-aminolevulinate synthase